jgi:hypothetical protein
MDAGAIRESNNPFSSNVVLVRKSDGSLRMCIDFRTLSKRTIRDAHSKLPSDLRTSTTLEEKGLFDSLIAPASIHSFKCSQTSSLKEGGASKPLLTWNIIS